jgi:hypothetical protein
VLKGFQQLQKLSVTLGEAKGPTVVLACAQKKEILRFAQNDRGLRKVGPIADSQHEYLLSGPVDSFSRALYYRCGGEGRLAQLARALP